jgi:ABC-type cobalt transport system substrate-binding protein
MKRLLEFLLKIIGIFCLALLLTSCVVGRYYEGAQISEEKIREIKPGVTTKAEIISWFGPPQNYISPTIFNEILREIDVTREPLTNYPFANILSYQYNRGNIRAIVLVLFNFVDAKVKSDHLVIFFDDNEKVKYYGFHKGTDELQ